MDHRDSLELVLRGAGVDLVKIPDFPTWAAGAGVTPAGVSGRLGRVRDQIFGTGNKEYLRQAVEAIDGGSINTVLAFWGTGPIAEIKALKRLRPKVNFVLSLLCHPLGLTPIKVRTQHMILGGGMGSLDGLIVSSGVMRRYVAEHIRGGARVKTLVWPPFWSKEYGATNASSAVAERPKVLFMGRMDWRRGQPTDNVEAPLRELMAEGIDVHFSRSGEGGVAEAHGFPFDPVPIRQMADFAAPFDASLIVYDLSRAKVTDRFEVTVPDRLITSACAGIPIALPAEGYAACREYLEPYGAVIEYTSMAHLAGQLRDRERVARLKETARRQSQLYRAERVLPELLRFLDQLHGG